MTAGRFEIHTSDQRKHDFDLVRKTGDLPPPADQWAVCRNVYDTKNIVWLLNEKKAFAADGHTFASYMDRLRLAARSGCAIDHVAPEEALKALEAIRNDVVELKGRPAKYRYLLYLALWAAIFLAVALGMMLAAEMYYGSTESPVKSYLVGYLSAISASVVAAWLSVAATRREISFYEMPQYLDFTFEPFIRLLFVSVLTLVLAFLLRLDLLTITVGNIQLDDVADPAAAILIGLIAGIAEQAVTVQVVERIKGFAALPAPEEKPAAVRPPD